MRSFISAAVVALLILITVTVAAFAQAWSVVEDVQVTMEEAIDLAATRGDGAVLAVHTATLEGNPYYEILVLNELRQDTYYINAADGAISEDMDNQAVSSAYAGGTPLFQDDEDDQLNLDAVRDAPIQSIDNVLRAGNQAAGGRLVALQLEQEGDRWIYDLVFTMENGEWAEAEVDAVTGETIEVESMKAKQVGSGAPQYMEQDDEAEDKDDRED